MVCTWTNHQVTMYNVVIKLLVCYIFRFHACAYKRTTDFENKKHERFMQMKKETLHCVLFDIHTHAHITQHVCDNMWLKSCALCVTEVAKGNFETSEMFEQFRTWRGTNYFLSPISNKRAAFLKWFLKASQSSYWNSSFPRSVYAKIKLSLLS